MKKFRDKEVIGWTLVAETGRKEFVETVNELMDKYDFVDCQYSTCYDTNCECIEYSAFVLLGEKNE